MKDLKNNERISHKDWFPVFTDTFDSYPQGDFSEKYSAIEEVHYLKKHINQGGWVEISTHHMFPHYGVKWIIHEEAGKKVLKQLGHNIYHRRNWKYPIKKFIFRRKEIPNLFFPAFATGEYDWQNYIVRANLKIFSKKDISGILFRMEDSRHHLIFCLKNKHALLYKRHQNNLQIIAKRKYSYDINITYELKVSAIEDNISCSVNGEVLLKARCDSYMSGKVGIITNVPSEYSLFEVLIPKHPSSINEHTRCFTPETKNKVNQPPIPQMKLWKKIHFPDKCSGRTIRFGDLTGSGTVDFVVVQGAPQLPGNSYNSINCLTAIDISGNILWAKGENHKERNCLCSDLPVQIYDIDNDGHNEVICARDCYLQILDGQTGEIKNQTPTPTSVPPHDKLPNTLGDAIFICNLSGSPHPMNILLKDRHSKIWAYDNKLNLLWAYHYQNGELGHFPFSADINNDGKDEILLGNVLLDADGKELWDLKLGDHADASAIIRSKPTDDFTAIIAASDEGFLLVNPAGKIKKQLRIGHMQTVTCANLIPEFPGLQFATNTYWGNPGIIYILDESGDILTKFQPSTKGSPILPVKWLNDGKELLLLSAAPDETGGLYDAYGSQILAFPDDGHPTLCYEALDLSNNGWDELICWDHEQLWIYTKNTNSECVCAKPSAIKYPPLYNGSNYRSNISLIVE